MPTMCQARRFHLQCDVLCFGVFVEKNKLIKKLFFTLAVSSYVVTCWFFRLK